MNISVLVVSYNVRALLGRCLASVREAHDVVVVDNGSTDGTVEFVQQNFPQVKLLAWPDNRGFSAAVNAAAAAARGDLFLLLNPDAALLPGVWPRLATLFAERRDAVALGLRQVDERGRLQLSVGLKPTLFGELLRCAVQRRFDAGGAMCPAVVNWLLRRPVAVPWVAGSALLVRRRDFERIGGFDERFFLYFEDIDFCLRLAAGGGRVYFEPRLTVVHHRGASAVTNSRVAARAYRQSQLHFWGKHRGARLQRVWASYLAWRGLLP